MTSPWMIKLSSKGLQEELPEWSKGWRWGCRGACRSVQRCHCICLLKKKKKSSVEIGEITLLNVKYFMGLIYCSIAACPASRSVHLFPWQPADLSLPCLPVGLIWTPWELVGIMYKVGVGCQGESFDAVFLWLKIFLSGLGVYWCFSPSHPQFNCSKLLIVV